MYYNCDVISWRSPTDAVIPTINLSAPLALGWAKVKWPFRVRLFVKVPELVDVPNRNDLGERLCNDFRRAVGDYEIHSVTRGLKCLPCRSNNQTPLAGNKCLTLLYDRLQHLN